MAASSAITRYPALSRPQLDRFGPLMKAMGIWKLKEIPNFLEQGVSVKIVPLTAARAVRVEYVISNQAHTAVIRFEDGRIVCDYCSLANKPVSWCNHIQIVVKRRCDQALYAIQSSSPAYDGEVYSVPLIPTEGIFVPITIKVNEDHSDVIDVRISLTEIEDETETEEFHIGNLRRHQFGTSEIRSLLVDFLESWMSNPKYFHQMDPKKFAPQGASGVSPFSNRFYFAATGALPWHEERDPALVDVPQF